MQSSCYAGEAYSLTHIYSHTYKQPSGDLHIYNIPIFVLFTEKKEIEVYFLPLKSFRKPSINHLARA